MTRISKQDVNAISHINHVTNGLHDLATELYEDLMDRENDKAKDSAQNICKLMAELIQSLNDDI
jgi:hypothetical protein